MPYDNLQEPRCHRYSSLSLCAYAIQAYLRPHERSVDVIYWLQGRLLRFAKQSVLARKCDGWKNVRNLEIGKGGTFSVLPLQPYFFTIARNSM